MSPPDSSPPCPVCGASCGVLGAVDFNKCCEEARGMTLPPSGRQVVYLLCGGCGFCFAPEFSGWTEEDFQREIYNADYIKVDPDYAGTRPRVNADTLIATLGGRHAGMRHLDYGGGAGMLSRLLRQAGWDSVSYDPFVDRDIRPESLGQFGLVTCFEVFEHVADVAGLASRLQALLAPEGLMLVSTLVSDGQLAAGQALTWWYAAPRNGHISLFSSRSLAVLAQRHGFNVASFSPDMHVLWRGGFPAWASHLLKA